MNKEQSPLTKTSQYQICNNLGSFMNLYIHHLNSTDCIMSSPTVAYLLAFPLHWVVFVHAKFSVKIKEKAKMLCHCAFFVL